MGIPGKQAQMKNIMALAFFTLILVTAAFAQSGQERDTSGLAHTEWIATALRSMQAIEVGMTRSQLMKVFTIEGGLEFKSATTAQRTYVYRKCPYIKVDVKLAISGPHEDLPADKVLERSRPYLEWTVGD